MTFGAVQRTGAGVPELQVSQVGVGVQAAEVDGEELSQQVLRLPDSTGSDELGSFYDRILLPTKLDGILWDNLFHLAARARARRTDLLAQGMVDLIEEPGLLLRVPGVPLRQSERLELELREPSAARSTF